jgi:histidinol-phosphate aminotransferase
MSRFVRRTVQTMHPYVPGEQLRGADMIKLNTNENPYPPSPAVAAVLDQFPTDVLRRYPDPTAGSLRDSIASLHKVTPEQVIIGNGSDELLALCLRAFVERDQKVGYFDPSYSLYPVLAAIEELAVLPVALPDDFSWHMPEDYSAGIFFLTNPNAPTSMLFPKAQVSAFCTRFNGVVVIDEAYVDFAEQDCLDLARTHDNVLVMRTFSKSFSLAAIRLGYAIGSQPLIEALLKIKDSYNVDLITQQIGLAALSDVASMRANTARIIATRERFTSALIERGWQVFPSQTNFLWTRPARESAGAVFEYLRAQQILVRYFDSDRLRGYLRISIGTDEEMTRLIACLDRR